MDRKRCQRPGLHPASVSSKGIRFSSLSCQGKPLSKPVSILHIGRRLMLALKLVSRSGEVCVHTCVTAHMCMHVYDGAM